MIRVILPQHLRTLARVAGEVVVEPAAPATIGSVLDAIEEKFPMLRGCIRDYGTHKRRPFVRYLACQEDLSLDPDDKPLPDSVVAGAEPFIILGAIAGG